MPANLVHCQGCRALLNDDLDPDSVEIPQWTPLQELEAMIELKPRGYFVECPHCKQELRINGKYLGETVSCKYCNGSFAFDPKGSALKTTAYYALCPHCNEELRLGSKYANSKVACKHCAGHIHFLV
jgi:hypothetical protein